MHVFQLNEYMFCQLEWAERLIQSQAGPADPITSRAFIHPSLELPVPWHRWS